MKKFSSFLSVCVVLSVVLGNFSLPVLAYEKNGVNFEQIKTGTISNTTFNKINSISRSVNGLSQDSLIIKTGKTGLEKSQQILVPQKNYVEGEILVKYKNTKIDLNTSSGRATALNFIRSKSLEKKEDLRKINTSVLRIKDGKTVEQKVAELKNDPNVEYAQPNFQYYPLAISSDDTYKANLWGLDNTGQSVNGVFGTDDADINAPEAWAINEGTNSSTIVAVIDTGVAYNHPDLAGNMWDGTSCKNENGDLLGGCNYGYDYQDNDKTPLPTTSSHGTHIAGTIAAEKNNTEGIIGVAPQAKIMALKSSLTTADNVKSINFAKQNGAKVINASWGTYSTSGEHYDIAMYNAIKDFSGLFIVAAGNANYNHDDGLDAHKSYPDGFKITTPIGPGLDNIIVVAATDQKDDRATFSDYGVTSVDVGAPGVNIYSTGFTQELFTDAILPSFTNTLFTETIGSWKTGTWADVGGNGSNKNAQANSSYINDDDGVLTLTAPQDTTVHGGNVWLGFYLYAGIESSHLCLNDYLSIQVDNNDNDWVEKAYGCGIINGSQEVNLGTGKTNMRIRFVWHTNSSVVGLQVPIVDDITISNTNSYQYMDGTSMAAPHVAGLAALVWGTKPNLTYTDVKNSILNTGDSLPSLATTTVTGKRINAFNALDSITPPVISNVQTATTTATSTTVIWSTDLPATSKVTYSTTTPVSASSLSVSTSTLVTNHSMELTGLSASTTYYFYTESSDVYGNVATSTEQSFNTFSVPDTTAPVIDSFTIPETSNSLTVSISSFTAHDNVGVTGYMLTETSDIPSASDPSWLVTAPTDYTFSSEGAKTLYAWVKDAAGNISSSLNDSVTITLPLPPDTEAPVIAFHSDIIVGNDLGQAGAIVNYTLPTATDNVDVSVLVICSPPAGTFFPIGDTTITCDATDVAENHAIQTLFKITVTDTEAPVITLTGENPQVIEVGTAYTELGATVSDNQPGSVITIDSSSVNIAVVGSYTVTYDAVDVSGNHAVQVTRTVDVIDELVTLQSIVITHPADKLSYFVGESLDLTGLEVTGIYSDASTKVETITEANVTGFDSSIPVTGQVLTITIGGKTTTYTIDVVAPLSSTKAITTFNFIAPVATGVINETDHTIAVTVPFGTDVTALIPTITITGASVSPTSGLAQDFTNPVTYTVTAADSSTQAYIVTVTVAANTAADILSFNSTSPVAIGVISGTNITLTVPFGTNLTDLPITISLSLGASVLPVAGNTTFIDGVATIYTVTAQDAVTTQNYSVTVTVAANSAKDITSFNFAGLTPNVTGVISGTDITLNVPYGTDVTALVPTIVITGASVSPNDGVAQDFTSLVTYTVTAVDASTQDYIVTITIAVPSSAKVITSFVIGSSTGTIDEMTHTVAVTVPFGTVVTALAPNIVVSDKATVDPASGVVQDFTNPVTYTVTAEDNTTQAYIVTVTVATPSNVVTITSATYTVSAGGTANETITNIPSGTSKATFLAALIKSQADQTWNDTGIADPVVTGNTLVVTAQDGITIVTYTITVNAPAATPTPTPAPNNTSAIVIPTITKKGDANGDNKVDKYDFSLMMSNWGKIGTNICDFNGDGKVDKYDFALLMSGWSL